MNRLYTLFRRLLTRLRLPSRRLRDRSPVCRLSVEELLDIKDGIAEVPRPEPIQVQTPEPIYQLSRLTLPPGIHRPLVQVDGQIERRTFFAIHTNRHIFVARLDETTSKIASLCRN